MITEIFKSFLIYVGDIKEYRVVDKDRKFVDDVINLFSTEVVEMVIRYTKSIFISTSENSIGVSKKSNRANQMKMQYQFMKSLDIEQICNDGW